jgi:hypothetical protein
MAPRNKPDNSEQDFSGDNLHPADATSYPGPNNPPIERPPYSTTRPDVPIKRTMTEGAGAGQTAEGE